MFGKLFGKKKSESESGNDVKKPRILGLEVGTSFSIDTLGIKLHIDKLVIEDIGKDHIIHSAGEVNLDGTRILRFYTDDEAWLQVVCQGELKEENIQDVKLFHYYDTFSVDSQKAWDELLDSGVAKPSYDLEGHTFMPVWASVDEDGGKPVHMREICYDESDDPSETDQFAMLFEREVDAGEELYEFLYVSAEEVETEHNTLDRCLVLSTGINLSPAQINIG